MMVFVAPEEVFAGLMGVLGTIVGFYFGSAEKATPPLEISAIQNHEITINSCSLIFQAVLGHIDT